MPAPSTPPPPRAPDACPLHLEYARDPRHPLRRHRGQILRGLILATLALLTLRYAPAVWRHVDALLPQSRLSTYLAPEDFVVAEEIEQPSLQVHPAPGSHAYAVNTYPVTPWSRVIARPPYADERTVYLGPRTAPQGHTRVLHAFLARGYVSLPGPRPTPDNTSFGLVIDVYDPAALTRPARRMTRIAVGFGVPATKVLTLHAGRPDPADAARVLIQYTSDRGGGTLRLTLAPADIVTLENPRRPRLPHRHPLAPTLLSPWTDSSGPTDPPAQRADLRQLNLRLSASQ